PQPPPLSLHDALPIYFAPDGKSIYFTSDRGGSPQIYRVATTGGAVSRVTFDGSYNVSPRVSPDGRKLAYVTRREGGFFIMIKDRSEEHTSELQSREKL